MAGEEEVGKTLIVGMKMDARGRELLTWSLVKVAGAGDRVIAMHVLPAGNQIDLWNKKKKLGFHIRGCFGSGKI